MTNNDGDPIEGGSLCTQVTYEHGQGSSCGEAQTDSHGQFQLRVPLGEIGVFAEKLDGGYWPPAWENSTPPRPHKAAGIKTVILTPESPRPSPRQTEVQKI